MLSCCLVKIKATAMSRCDISQMRLLWVSLQLINTWMDKYISFSFADCNKINKSMQKENLKKEGQNNWCSNSNEPQLSFTVTIYESLNQQNAKQKRFFTMHIANWIHLFGGCDEWFRFFSFFVGSQQCWVSSEIIYTYIFYFLLLLFFSSS